MKQLLCPQCNTDVVRRTRWSLLERLFSLLSIYPFRGQRCGRRFRARQRGVRYFRKVL
jgi:hypothetical protein